MPKGKVVHNVDKVLSEIRAAKVDAGPDELRGLHDAERSLMEASGYMQRKRRKTGDQKMREENARLRRQLAEAKKTSTGAEVNLKTSGKKKP